MRQLITILLISCLTAAFSQQKLNYSFRKIDQTNGLLHNSVYSIVQDERGFIWLGTGKGLQRFDGLRFVNYQPEFANPINARQAPLNLYAEARKLWVTENGQLKSLDLYASQFTSYDKEQLPDHPIFSYDSYTDWNNSQWLINDFAIYNYDSASKKMMRYLINLPLKRSSTALVKDELTKETWVADYRLLFFFDPKTKKVYSPEHNSIGHPLLQQMKGKPVFNIMIDSHHNIWLVSWDHFLYRYDQDSKKLNTYSLKDIQTGDQLHNNGTGTLSINCVYEDKQGTIWVGTQNAGLLRFNRLHDNFDFLITDPENNQGIKYNYNVYCIYQDSENNIWLGTDRGLNIFNPYRNFIQSVQHESNDHSLPKSEILAFTQPSTGDILVGTWGGGISIFDSALQFKRNIFLEGAYENNLVWCFIQKDDGKIWVGCQHGFLQTYDPVSRKISTEHPPAMNNFTIRCMQKDAAGNIWFGLNDGKIAKWDKVLNKFLPYNDSLPGIQQTFYPVYNIFIDHFNNIWVSTEHGLKQFDPVKRIYTTIYLHEPKNGTSISSDNICGIEQYDDSTLIVATRDAGLNFFNLKNRAFTRINIKDGLPVNSIYAVKKDNDHNIWFTSDYGLFKLTPNDKKIVSYNMPAGMINSSFEFNNFFQIQDGRWLTATLTEVIAFRPDNLEQKRNPPNTTIAGFNVLDKPLFIDSLLFAHKPIKLSYDENFFTVEFAALNYSSPQQINYYYRLEGVDKDWVSGGTKRFASYTDLRPGNYTFSVKAENGTRDGGVTSFNIIIAPPFWKSWWFITILSFVILLLVYLFIKGREKSIKAIESEKLKVQQLNAEQYKSKLELEQIVNYFSSTLIDKTTVDDVLWDVAKNLIGRLGFVDCIMYLWNEDKTTMIQKAGYGVKGSIEEMNKLYFDVVPGQGVVGYVMQTKEAVLIPDTSIDSRYRPDEMVRLSEITVPVIYNNELIGVIDCEHHEKNFFTHQHLQILSTIATLMANKIKSIEAEQSLQRTRIEIYSMNDQLSKAKLEALQSQMNPHFIFNCINSIDALIQSNNKYHATVYLNKFAKLIRNILDSSKQNTVTLATDLETLKLYLELEQFRHRDKFTAAINTEDALLEDDYKVPPLIIQPFVENAILHGIRHRSDNDGRLSVSVSKQDDYLRYIIEDNGIGRSAARNLIRSRKPSYGIDISNDRVRLFNNEEKASVQIIDLMENGIAAGTKVEVLLKIQ